MRSQKTSFFDKLNALLDGKNNKNNNAAPQSPHPPQSSARTAQNTLTPPPPPPPPPEENPAIADLNAQVKKLAKTQFKTNALQESQLAQQQEALTALKQSLQTQLEDARIQQQQAVEAAQLELLTAMLPALDGLDAAFENGKKQLFHLRLSPQSKKAFIAWLDGVRLARIRLLDTLAAYNVSPIPTIGKPFNPHLHVVAATRRVADLPGGVIVAEDRRGYIAKDKVLRFSEVVVTQSE